MSISGSSVSSSTEDADDASAERLLALAERNVRATRTAGRDRLRVAAEWARLHRRRPGLSHWPTRSRPATPTDAGPRSARPASPSSSTPPPPGQTRVENLGKLGRRHHRVKTHAPGWSVTQLPGHRYLWITPHGRYRVTDAAGTHVISVSWTDLQLAA